MKILYVMELTRPASALGMKMPTQTMLAGLAGAMFLFVLCRHCESWTDTPGAVAATIATSTRPAGARRPGLRYRQNRMARVASIRSVGVIGVQDAQQEQRRRSAEEALGEQVSTEEAQPGEGSWK